MSIKTLFTLTEEHAARISGPIVYKDDKFVIRARRDGDTMNVSLHVVDPSDGKECVPLGYVLGDNKMIMKGGDNGGR